jgi:hypothetical protein
MVLVPTFKKIQKNLWFQFKYSKNKIDRTSGLVPVQVFQKQN